MVGFFCESSKADASGGTLNHLKSKSSSDPEIHSLDPEARSADFNALPLTSLEPFVDFDCIQDWIEDIQVSDCEDYRTADIGSGLGEITCFEDPIVDCFSKGMDDKEILGSVKVECYGANELAVEDSAGVVGKGKSDGFVESNLSDFVKPESGSAEMNGSGGGLLGSLNCSIEEGLEKFSLVSEKDDVVDVKDMTKMDSEVVIEDAQSDSESESESESESGTSSSSSASSSASSSSSESEDEAKEMVKEQKIDVEDGEIMDSDVEKMVSWTNDGKADDDEGEVDSAGVVGKGKSDGFVESNLSDFVKPESGSAEMNGSGGGLLGSLNCSIEEGLEKFSLVSEKDDVVDVKDMTKMDSEVVIEDAQSDSESESESESESGTSSSSSASSSASSSSSESEDEAKEMVKEQKIDVEDGEIMDSDVEKMVSWTDDGKADDDEGEVDSASDINPDLEFVDDIDEDGETDLPKGPIRSKNELEDLPLVPEVTASLQPEQQILPVGFVSAVLGTKVIVEGSEKHNPISESSILWITERRLALGIIDEIFGPVKTPYYVVRYNSEGEVPSDIPIGTTIGFVPEFAGHVLNDQSLYQKGYDASGENDEEIDEVEFSDDEKEAEYRKMLKMSKRGNNNESQGAGNKKNRKNTKSRDNTWTKNQPSTSQSPIIPLSHPNKAHPHVRSPSPLFTQGNQSGTTTTNLAFTGGPSRNGSLFPGGPNTFIQMPQSGPGPINGNWSNGMPPHPQNMAISSGFQSNASWGNGMPPQHQNMANAMPWMMQQNYPLPVQMPSNIPFPWQHQQQVPQQQFDLSQLLSGINGPPLGPMNFNMGGPNAPWAGMLGQNFPGQAPFLPGPQNPNGHLPMFPGFVPNGQQTAGVSTNSVPATSLSRNEEVSSQTSQGVSSGRGRGRKPFQQRGGRFGGRRGRTSLVRKLAELS